MHDELTLKETLVALVTIGLLVGLGKLLASQEPFSWRLAIGRSIVSAGLAVAAGSLLAFMPGLSALAVIGLAAASAVIGEQFIEKLLHARIAR